MTSHAQHTRTRTYALLLVMQTLAALILLTIMIPVYGAISIGLGHQIRKLPESPVLLIAALLLFHCTYWFRLLRVPVSVAFHSLVLSHIVLFSGRLSFIFGTSFFALVVYRFIPALSEITDAGLFVVRFCGGLVILFSLYCYSTELERLGVALRPPVKT